jgi:hypothetical protein
MAQRHGTENQVHIGACFRLSADRLAGMTPVLMKPKIPEST